MWRKRIDKYVFWNDRNTLSVLSTPWKLLNSLKNNLVTLQVHEWNRSGIKDGGGLSISYLHLKNQSCLVSLISSSPDSCYSCITCTMDHSKIWHNRLCLSISNHLHRTQEVKRVHPAAQITICAMLLYSSRLGHA